MYFISLDCLFFYIYLLLCLYACSCTCLLVCCACTHVEVREDNFWVSSCLRPLLWGRVSPVSCHSTVRSYLMAFKLSGHAIFLSFLPPWEYWNYRYNHGLYQVSYMDSRNLNPGFRFVKQVLLHTEPSAQPSCRYHFKSCSQFSEVTQNQGFLFFNVKNSQTVWSYATVLCVTFIVGFIWPHPHSVRVYYILRKLLRECRRFEYFDHLHRVPPLLVLIISIGYTADCSPSCNTFSFSQSIRYTIIFQFSQLQ